MYGFDYTEPRQLSEQKNVASYANGQTSTSAANYYLWGFFRRVIP